MHDETFKTENHENYLQLQNSLHASNGIVARIEKAFHYGSVEENEDDEPVVVQEKERVNALLRELDQKLGDSLERHNPEDVDMEEVERPASPLLDLRAPPTRHAPTKRRMSENEDTGDTSGLKKYGRG